MEDVPATVEERVEQPATNELRVEAHGGFGGHGAGLGGMFSVRHHAFVIAPSITYFAPLFLGGKTYAYRMGAGLAWLPSKVTRFELLGVGGAHVYSGAGADIGSLGADATCGFLGAWAGVSGRAGAFTLGAWLYYEGDLARGSVPSNDPVIVEPGFFISGPTRHPIPVGQDAVGILLRLGLAFDPD